MVLEDRFASAALEDRFASAALEDRFASATLEDRSFTLTRRTSRHSVPIFKGSARSSSEVIFQLKAIYRLKADLQGLCPIFKRSDLQAAGDLQTK